MTDIKRMEHVINVTIDDLVQWCIERGLDPDEVTISAAHLKWVSPQTEAEAKRAKEWADQSAARTEEWEREAYARLKAKFGSNHEG